MSTLKASKARTLSRIALRKSFEIEDKAGYALDRGDSTLSDKLYALSDSMMDKRVALRAYANKHIGYTEPVSMTNPASAYFE